MYRSLHFVASDPIDGLIRALDPARRMGLALRGVTLQSRTDSALIAMELDVPSDEAFSTLVVRVGALVGISDVHCIPACEPHT